MIYIEYLGKTERWEKLGVHEKGTDPLLRNMIEGSCQ